MVGRGVDHVVGRGVSTTGLTKNSKILAVLGFAIFYFGLKFSLTMWD